MTDAEKKVVSLADARTAKLYDTIQKRYRGGFWTLTSAELKALLVEACVASIRADRARAIEPIRMSWPFGKEHPADPRARRKKRGPA